MKNQQVKVYFNPYANPTEDNFEGTCTILERIRTGEKTVLCKVRMATGKFVTHRSIRKEDLK